MHQYLYKLGHQPYVSVLELKQFINPEGSLKAGELGKFALSNDCVEIDKLGGTIARLRVVESTEDLETNYLKFLTQGVEKELKNSKTNKIGIFSNAVLRSHKTILACKELGAKKINVLSQNTFPSIGHVKSALTWFGLLRTKTQLLVCVIEEYSDQETWQALDRKIPHNDMKRGIMNLKLSKILMNLTDDEVIWDPFCGLARTLIGGIQTKKELIGSDRDGFILNDAHENYNKAFEILNNRDDKPEKPLIKLFAHDVTKVIDYQLLPKDGFSIVTEGYLGPGLNKLPDDQLRYTLNQETVRLWTAFFEKLANTNVRDIVFCIPAYKDKRMYHVNHNFLDKLDELLPTHERVNHYQDIYARDTATVGHQILILKRK